MSMPEPKQGNDTFSGELTISTYNENAYLQAATKKYEENHEGVTIIINEYMSRTDSSTGTDKNSDKYM